MTGKKRFHRTINYEKPDRVPYLTEGIREDVLSEWREQGMPQKKSLSELFKFDGHLEIDIEFDPVSFTDRFPDSEDDLHRLRRTLLQIDLVRLWTDYKNKIEFNRIKDQIVMLKIHHGLFLSLGIHNWKGFGRAMNMLAERPDFVKRIMDLQVEFIAKFAGIVMNDLKIDAVIFNEPIGGNVGPLISPDMYEEFALRKYLPLLNIIHNYQIDTVILRSYANIKMLIPGLLQYGFNCLWACETESDAMNYKDIRNEFGRDLRLIGGIDLDILLYGKEEIKRELMEKVPPLLRSGGYIPLADGRIRKEVPFSNYVYYRTLLEELTE